jgi:UDP-N-acetylmuramate dehydrogenase
MIFDIDTAHRELSPHFQGRLYRNEPLSRHCAFGVGGPADIWISLTTQRELFGIVSTCAEQSWPLLIVGSGTNVLYSDAGVRGIVARIALDNYTIEEQGETTALLIAEAGVRWPRLLHELAPLGWGGLEFGASIPGTLGGGVVSNAGTPSGELGQVLEWIEVLDARGSNQGSEDQLSVPLIRRYLHDELDLRYRYSRFREQRRTQYDEHGHLVPLPHGLIEPPEIVVRVGIRLHREHPQKLHEAIARQHRARKVTEKSYFHAAPVFKNPTGDKASRLIIAAGLQERMHGAAQVSVQDANYIINRGAATASDIAALIEEIHQQVLTQFGVNLELDIDVRGEWSTR